MPTQKKDTDKKSVYKSEMPNEGTPYKAPENVNSDLLELRTTVFQRDGFRTYWARESEIRIRVMDGYELADPTHYQHLGAVYFQDASGKKGSAIRLPSQDSNEDLVLMEIPLERYKQNKAKEQARCDAIEAQIKGKKSLKPDAHVSMTTEGKTSVSN
jgi:hypothetical protein